LPIYDYKCECGKDFEHFQPFEEEKLTHCLCEDNKKVKRLISKPMIISDDIGRGIKRMPDRELYKELDE